MRESPEGGTVAWGQAGAAEQAPGQLCLHWPPWTSLGSCERLWWAGDALLWLPNEREMFKDMGAMFHHFLQGLW